MRAYVLALLSLVAVEGASAQVNGISLTEAYLRARKFTVAGFLSCELVFAGPDYRLGCSTEGAGFATAGTWRLVNGVVELTQTSGKDLQNPAAAPIGRGFRECRLQASTSPQDYDFETYLECKGEAQGDSFFANSVQSGTRFGIAGSEPYGKERSTFTGVKFIVLKPSESRTTSATMLRESPSITGKVQAYNKICGGGYSGCMAPREAMAPFPPGYKVEIIGRSPQKSQVGGRTSYWYLVKIPVASGWMFGGYLEKPPE